MKKAGNFSLALVCFTTLGLVVMLGLWTVSVKQVPGDTKLLLNIRPKLQELFPASTDTLNRWMNIITDLGGYLVLTTVVIGMALLLWSRTRQVKHALHIVGAAVSALLVSHGLKLLFNRPRPQLLSHLTEVGTASFPSGHAFLASTVYLLSACLLASWFANRLVKAIIWALAVMMVVAIGISRVYLGVHWPSDVLAGWLLGTTWLTGWCPQLRKQVATGLSCPHSRQNEPC